MGSLIEQRESKMKMEHGGGRGSGGRGVGGRIKSHANDFCYRAVIFMRFVSDRSAF